MALNYAGLSGDVCSLNSTLANQDGVVDELDVKIAEDEQKAGKTSFVAP